MAQTGYTPILIYSSSTGGNAPAAGSLTNSTLGSELAINITDGKLFYKDNANAVQVIGWKVTPTSAGGTGLTSYTAGDTLYYASGTTLSKLAIGGTGYYMSSSGTAPQWSAPAALTKTDDTNVTLTLGGSPNTALLNAASLTLGWTGQLSESRGGTGIGTYAVGDLLYASGTTTLSKLAIGTAYYMLGVNAGATAPSWQPSATSVLTAQGDLLYASAANTLARLAKNTTATRYLSNTGSSNNPAWAQIDLTNGVTGTLPVGNGGTGITSLTANYIPYGNGSSAFNSSGGLQYNGQYFNAGTSGSYRVWLGTIDTTTYYGTGLVMAADAGSNQQAFRWASCNGSGSIALALEKSTNSQSYGGDPTSLTYSELLRFTGTGIAFTASNSGITFANSSALVNTQLNDYEEGSWTPTVTSGTGTITSLTTQGRYTKVGRLVVINWYVEITNNGTGASYLNVTGLPFTIGQYGGSGAVRSATALGTTNVIQAPNGGTAFTVWKYDNTYPVATNSMLNATFSYFV